MLNSIQGEDNLVFLVTDQKAEVLAGIELELKFSELVSRGRCQRELSVQQTNWQFSGCTVSTCPVQDLSYHTRTARTATWFETKVNVVVIRLVEELPGRNRAPYSSRDRLQAGIEQETKAVF